MATAKQIAANRTNASKITGPTTSQGKAHASQNALKHGLTGGSVLLASEGPDEFDEVVRSFSVSLNPDDPFEEKWVTELVKLY